MEKIAPAVNWGEAGWSRFFEERGESWRDKDYWYLDSIFDLSQLSGSLLDVGCALGDGMPVLRRRCTGVRELAGTDFSSYAIETNRGNPALAGVRFFQHDLNQPLTRQFDNVICMQTLEHLEDPRRAFRNLYDAASRLLLVATPYRNRRPDQDHLWSFDETDFAEFRPRWILAQGGVNIFWLCDKDGSGFRFRGALRRLAGRWVARWRDARRRRGASSPATAAGNPASREGNG